MKKIINIFFLIIHKDVIFTTPPHEQDATRGQFFKRNLTGSNSDFFFVERLPYQGWRAQFALLFTHKWKANNWIYTFSKDISVTWNANSFIQGYNSVWRAHFSRREPLLHKQRINLKIHNSHKGFDFLINCKDIFFRKKIQTPVIAQ